MPKISKPKAIVPNTAIDAESVNTQTPDNGTAEQSAPFNTIEAVAFTRPVRTNDGRTIAPRGMIAMYAMKLTGPEVQTFIQSSPTRQINETYEAYRARRVVSKWCLKYRYSYAPYIQYLKDQKQS